MSRQSERCPAVHLRVWTWILPLLAVAIAGCEDRTIPTEPATDPLAAARAEIGDLEHDEAHRAIHGRDAEHLSPLQLREEALVARGPGRGV